MELVKVTGGMESTHLTHRRIIEELSQEINAARLKHGKRNPNIS